jgi:hypothetical protein
MSVCNYDYQKSPKAGMILDKFKALNQTTSFELHRDSMKTKKHLDGSSAVRQHRVGVYESKDSTNEIMTAGTCEAGWNLSITSISAYEYVSSQQGPVRPHLLYMYYGGIEWMRRRSARSSGQ